MYNKISGVNDFGYVDRKILNQVGYMYDLRFCQHIIDLIPEPCFLVLDVKGEKFLANIHLIKLLKYRSSSEFKDHVTNFYQLFQSDKASLIEASLNGSITKYSINHSILNLIQKKGSLLKCEIKLKSIYISRLENKPTHFGRIVTEKKNSYVIDKTLLNLFNNDKFLDEAMVILDFKGNILSANRKLMIINFFADLTDKNFNLFEYIENSYKPKLNKCLVELRKGAILPPGQYKLVDKDNKVAYIEMYCKCVIYKKRKVIVALIRDITLSKETEKKLLHTIVQTEEKERQRFAQDLHDELGPFLSGLKLYINELESGGLNQGNKKLLYDYMHQMIDEAVNKVKMITSNLTPQNMIDEGLSASVQKMINKLNKSGQINIEFSTTGHESNFEHSFIITIYRIILELINNSLKHSASKNICISLAYKKKSLKLIYEDDGIGFDLKKELKMNKGIGLKSIMNRVELYQGVYKFSNRKKGIQFDMLFPSK